MLKNLEGLPADHPMRDLMTPMYHLQDHHGHENDQNPLLYQSHHHDANLNIQDNFHGMNSTTNYLHNMSKNPIHPMFNIQDMIAGSHLYDKNPVMSVPTHVDMPPSKAENDDAEDDEGDSGSGSDSPSKKRGKYRTYTDEEKAQILQLASKHGIEKTLELFSEGEHKLTKRKLRSWLESQDKVKGVKGRKSNEPNRDGYLYEWYIAFQNEHNRPPTRKEATKRALEITDDPKFQASKGWLDKFSRKFKVEFTPLKIVPPKTFKKGPFEDDISTATTMGSALITGEEDSPAKGSKKVKLDKLQPRKTLSAPVQEKIPEKIDLKVGPAKGQLTSNPHEMTQPGFHAPSHFSKPSQPSLNPLNPVADVGSHYNVQKVPSEGANVDAGKNHGYQMPSFYPMDYTMYNPFNYQGVYPNMPSYPLNYPMNMPMSYPPNFAENFQRLQQAMKKDEPKTDKTN